MNPSDIFQWVCLNCQVTHRVLEDLMNANLHNSHHRGPCEKTGGQQLASHAKSIGRGAYVKVPLCPPRPFG